MSASTRARSVAALPLMLTAALFAGTFAITPAADAAMTRHERVLDALHVVRAQKGDPYRYGADGPGRFDCSGLIYYSFRRAGFTNVPRTSDQQARFVDRVEKRNMKRGDLMFFYDGGGVYHVGVFAGWKDGRRWMVHSPYGGRNVHSAKPWTRQWFAGTLR